MQTDPLSTSVSNKTASADNPKAENNRNQQIVLMALGIALVLGAIICISLTASNHMGHFQESHQTIVVEDQFEEWIIGHYSTVTTNLVGVNYTLYALAALGGGALTFKMAKAMRKSNPSA